MNNIEWVKNLSTREKVFALESEMAKQPQVDLDVRHHFSYGIYGRELFIPAGVMLTGKLHKYPQLNILLDGTIDVLIEHKVERLTAPFVVSSPAGTKRIARAITDVRWLTVHATEETDLDKIEHTFIAQNEQEFLEFIKEQNAQFRLPLEQDDLKCLG